MDAGTIWWRLGAVAAHEDLGLASRQWVEEIVRDAGVFPWRGFAPHTPRGKPRFAGGSRGDFSVSHSRDTLLVAVTGSGRIGVDVELAPFAAFDSLSLKRRMLTTEERAIAQSHPDSSRRQYLARVWTAKEAFVKATGEGLARDFRRFTVPVLRTARAQALEACIALIPPARPPRFHRLTAPSVTDAPRS